MRIGVFGLGYVGAVGCACMCDIGHEIVGVDVVKEKTDRINRGESPIIETGIDDMLARASASGRLSATTSVKDAVGRTDLGIVCVGTPSTSTGGVDTRYLDRVCTEIGEAVKAHGKPFYAVLNRSTSLPTIHRALMRVLEESSGRTLGDGIGYVCHPEFLREGAAIHDFYNPPKIVYGASDPRSEALCRDLYPGIEAETFFTSVDVAAMVKYADNCYHAVKVTFGNEVGLICKSLGIDAHAVMEIFCRDRKLNISERYLRPGNPFGGSCLPKDLRGILDASRSTATPMPMLQSTLESNRLQIERLVKRIVAANGRAPIGLVGLSFKEGTDDVRESAMVHLVEQLLGKGIPVRIYDEHLAMNRLVGGNRSFALDSIPHLAEMLSNDLPAVVAQSRTLVVNHRLSPERWAKAGLKADQQILDLVGIPELKGRAGYDGLYW
ncbi:MAG: nucleotide sugar dehydrogenase [Phycisphaerales bacterium]